MAQKTFDVWVKNDWGGDFRICSKRSYINGDKLIDKDSAVVVHGSIVGGCDVSEWIGALDIKEGEVRSFKLTFKEN